MWQRWLVGKNTHAPIAECRFVWVSCCLFRTTFLVPFASRCGHVTSSYHWDFNESDEYLLALGAKYYVQCSKFSLSFTCPLLIGCWADIRTTLKAQGWWNHKMKSACAFESLVGEICLKDLPNQKGLHWNLCQQEIYFLCQATDILGLFVIAHYLSWLIQLCIIIPIFR